MPPQTRAAGLPAGLIASLATVTWLDADPNGDPLCCLLVVHQPARSRSETHALIEKRMRQVADSLGLGPPDLPPPDIGPRLRIIGSVAAMLRFDGTLYRKRITADPRWVRVLGEQTAVALVLGLDPLSRNASPAEIDAYLDTSAAGRRLLFGRTCAK